MIRAVDELIRAGNLENLTYAELGRRVGLRGKRIPEVLRGIAKELQNDGEIEMEGIEILQQLGEKVDSDRFQAKIQTFVKQAIGYYEAQLSG